MLNSDGKVAGKVIEEEAHQLQCTPTVHLFAVEEKEVVERAMLPLGPRQRCAAGKHSGVRYPTTSISWARANSVPRHCDGCFGGEIRQLAERPAGVP